MVSRSMRSFVTEAVERGNGSLKHRGHLVRTINTCFPITEPDPERRDFKVKAICPLLKTNGRAVGLS